MADSFVCCQLCYITIFIRNVFRYKLIAYYILSGQYFKPGASSNITSDIYIQMISVTIQMISNKRSTGILYSCSGRNYPIKVHKFTCFFYRFHYSFIHRYLIVIIFLEPGIPAIFSIGPCLMENNFRTLIYPFLYIFIQFRKICFVRIVHARERTGLLQTNVIPFFIGQSLRNTHITMVNFLTIKPNFTIIIRSRIFPDIIYMSFQRASTNKKVSYYKFITFCLSQFMQILFYRIL